MERSGASCLDFFLFNLCSCFIFAGVWSKEIATRHPAWFVGVRNYYRRLGYVLRPLDQRLLHLAAFADSAWTLSTRLTVKTIAMDQVWAWLSPGNDDMGMAPPKLRRLEIMAPAIECFFACTITQRLKQLLFESSSKITNRPSSSGGDGQYLIKDLPGQRPTQVG